MCKHILQQIQMEGMDIIMKVIMGADGFGVPARNAVREYLLEQGHEVTDISGENGIEYYKVGYEVGKAMSNKEYDYGFIFCGTGMGVNIVANKFPGVYCGLVESVTTAELCKIINNCNVLSMGGLFTPAYKAKRMAKAFLEAKFTEGFPDADPAFLVSAYEEIQKIEAEIYNK